MVEKEVLLLVGKKRYLDRLQWLICFLSVAALVLFGLTIVRLISYLSPDGLTEAVFPTAYLVLFIAVVLMLAFVLLIHARRHLIITNEAVRINQNGFTEIIIPYSRIATIAAKGENLVVIQSDGTHNEFQGLKNSIACAKEAMVAKKAHDAQNTNVQC